MKPHISAFQVLFVFAGLGSVTVAQAQRRVPAPGTGIPRSHIPAAIAPVRAATIPLGIVGGPRARVILEGIVAGPPRREDFFLRSGGQVFLVRPFRGEILSDVAGGDYVRIYGLANGLNVFNANVRIIRPQASSNWDDYGPAQ